MAQFDAGILHLGSLSFRNSCVIGDRYLSIAPCVERAYGLMRVKLSSDVQREIQMRLVHKRLWPLLDASSEQDNIIEPRVFYVYACPMPMQTNNFSLSCVARTVNN
jgi:hypothetical protein